MPRAVPRINNVVATFRSGKRLNLLKFSQQYGFDYMPSRFAAVSLRLRGSKTSTRRCSSTALAFSSGKFVITGARSENQALLSARKYIGLLNRLGERLSFLQFSIQNIVSSVDIGKPLLLAKIMEENTSECSYENRKFPGLVLRDAQSKLVVLVFRSGRCVITGAKSKRQLLTEWPRLYDRISKYTDDADESKCSREYAARLRRDAERMPVE